MQIFYHPPGKRGPFWYIRWTDAEGRRHERSTGASTRGGAETFAERLFLERARRRVPGAGETVAFDRAAEAYKAFARPSTADERLIDRLAAHFRDVDCRAITHAQLIAAAHELCPGRADSTKNRKVMAPAAAVLHYAADQKWCEYRRIRKFHESRLSPRRPATDADMAKLFQHLEEPPRGLPDGRPRNSRKSDPNLAHKRLLLAMLYELGLRISDYLRLDWTMIDLPNLRLRVHIAKTDRQAEISFSPVVAALMANLPRREGRLFPWATRRGVYAWLNRVRVRAGVHYTPHLSRHALATAAQDIPDKKAAELGVWADPRSLHRYQHVRPDAIPGRDAGFLVGKKGGRAA
ncbi:MAG TPA: tyrosine-type recombinase/integrase [Reyranella sp.]|nr:tyrosine-type recombinase/integrase [Reyranella sp.]